jgi:hypothetical protein
MKKIMKKIKGDEKIIVHFDLIDFPLKNMDNGVILSGEAYPIDEVTNNSRIYIHVDLDMYLDLLIEKRKEEYEEFYFTNCIFGNFNELKKNVLKEDSYIIISKGYLCGRNGTEDFVTIKKFK